MDAFFPFFPHLHRILLLPPRPLSLPWVCFLPLSLRVGVGMSTAASLGHSHHPKGGIGDTHRSSMPPFDVASGSFRMALESTHSPLTVPTCPPPEVGSQLSKAVVHRKDHNCVDAHEGAPPTPDEFTCRCDTCGDGAANERGDSTTNATWPEPSKRFVETGRKTPLRRRNATEEMRPGKRTPYPPQRWLRAGCTGKMPSDTHRCTVRRCPEGCQGEISQLVQPQEVEGNKSRRMNSPKKLGKLSWVHQK